MRVVVEGCTHGELDAVYESILRLERNAGKVDLLICCGDFQSIRDQTDLKFLACPPKYRQMGNFRKYYLGEKVAPILTLFIGGNHEAPNFLKDLYYGGWVAKNIYYLGHSGCVNVGGLRIAGISGIFNSRNYTRGHFEGAPYDDITMKSAYHMREFEVKKLAQLTGNVDILVCHDWPRGIHAHGDIADVLRKKDKSGQMKQEIAANTFGNPGTYSLIEKLKPRYCFAGHMHIKFTAVVKHETHETNFLALDKPQPGFPRREFMELLEIQPSGTADNTSKPITIRPQGFSPVPISERTFPDVELDSEWCAILKSAYETVNLTAKPIPAIVHAPKKEDVSSMTDRMDAVGKSIPFNVDAPDLETPKKQRLWLNDLLEIGDIWAKSTTGSPATGSSAKGPTEDIEVKDVDLNLLNSDEEVEDGNDILGLPNKGPIVPSKRSAGRTPLVLAPPKRQKMDDELVNVGVGGEHNDDLTLLLLAGNKADKGNEEDELELECEDELELECDEEEEEIQKNDGKRRPQAQVQAQVPPCDELELDDDLEVEEDLEVEKALPPHNGSVSSRVPTLQKMMNVNKNNEEEDELELELDDDDELEDEEEKVWAQKGIPQNQKAHPKATNSDDELELDADDDELELDADEEEQEQDKRKVPVVVTPIPRLVPAVVEKTNIVVGAGERKEQRPSGNLHQVNEGEKKVGEELELDDDLELEEDIVEEREAKVVEKKKGGEGELRCALVEEVEDIDQGKEKEYKDEEEVIGIKRSRSEKDKLELPGVKRIKEDEEETRKSSSHLDADFRVKRATTSSDGPFSPLSSDGKDGMIHALSPKSVGELSVGPPGDGDEDTSNKKEKEDEEKETPKSRTRVGFGLPESEETQDEKSPLPEDSASNVAVIGESASCGVSTSVIADNKSLLGDSASNVAVPGDVASCGVSMSTSVIADNKSLLGDSASNVALCGEDIASCGVSMSTSVMADNKSLLADESASNVALCGGDISPNAGTICTNMTMDSLSIGDQSNVALGGGSMLAAEARSVAPTDPESIEKNARDNNTTNDDDDDDDEARISSVGAASKDISTSNIAVKVFSPDHSAIIPPIEVNFSDTVEEGDATTLTCPSSSNLTPQGLGLLSTTSHPNNGAKSSAATVKADRLLTGLSLSAVSSSSDIMQFDIEKSETSSIHTGSNIAVKFPSPDPEDSLDLALDLKGTDSSCAERREKKDSAERAERREETDGKSLEGLKSDRVSTDGEKKSVHEADDVSADPYAEALSATSRKEGEEEEEEEEMETGVQVEKVERVECTPSVEAGENEHTAREVSLKAEEDKIVKESGNVEDEDGDHDVEIEIDPYAEALSATSRKEDESVISEVELKEETPRVEAGDGGKHTPPARNTITLVQEPEDDKIVEGKVGEKMDVGEEDEESSEDKKTFVVSESDEEKEENIEIVEEENIKKIKEETEKAKAEEEDKKAEKMKDVNSDDDVVLVDGAQEGGEKRDSSEEEDLEEKEEGIEIDIAEEKEDENKSKMSKITDEGKQEEEEKKDVDLDDLGEDENDDDGAAVADKQEEERSKMSKITEEDLEKETKEGDLEVLGENGEGVSRSEDKNEKSISKSTEDIQEETKEDVLIIADKEEEEKSKMSNLSEVNSPGDVKDMDSDSDVDVDIGAPTDEVIVEETRKKEENAMDLCASSAPPEPEGAAGEDKKIELVEEEDKKSTENVGEKESEKDNEESEDEVGIIDIEGDLDEDVMRIDRIGDIDEKKESPDGAVSADLDGTTSMAAAPTTLASSEQQKQEEGVCPEGARHKSCEKGQVIDSSDDDVGALDGDIDIASNASSCLE